MITSPSSSAQQQQDHSQEQQQQQRFFPLSPPPPQPPPSPSSASLYSRIRNTSKDSQEQQHGDEQQQQQQGVSVVSKYGTSSGENNNNHNNSISNIVSIMSNNNNNSSSKQQQQQQYHHSLQPMPPPSTATGGVGPTGGGGGGWPPPLPPPPPPPPMMTSTASGGVGTASRTSFVPVTTTTTNDAAAAAGVGGVGGAPSSSSQHVLSTKIHNTPATTMIDSGGMGGGAGGVGIGSAQQRQQFQQQQPYGSNLHHSQHHHHSSAGGGGGGSTSSIGNIGVFSASFSEHQLAGQQQQRLQPPQPPQYQTSSMSLPTTTTEHHQPLISTTMMSPPTSNVLTTEGSSSALSPLPAIPHLQMQQHHHKPQPQLPHSQPPNRHPQHQHQQRSQSLLDEDNTDRLGGDDDTQHNDDSHPIQQHQQLQRPHHDRELSGGSIGVISVVSAATAAALPQAAGTSSPPAKRAPSQQQRQATSPMPPLAGTATGNGISSRSSSALAVSSPHPGLYNHHHPSAVAAAATNTAAAVATAVVRAGVSRSSSYVMGGVTNNNNNNNTTSGTVGGGGNTPLLRSRLGRTQSSGHNINPTDGASANKRPPIAAKGGSHNHSTSHNHSATVGAGTGGGSSSKKGVLRRVGRRLAKGFQQQKSNSGSSNNNNNASSSSRRARLLRSRGTSGGSSGGGGGGRGRKGGVVGSEDEDGDLVVDDVAQAEDDEDDPLLDRCAGGHLSSQHPRLLHHQHHEQQQQQHHLQHNQQWLLQQQQQQHPSSSASRIPASSRSLFDHHTNILPHSDVTHLHYHGSSPTSSGVVGGGVSGGGIDLVGGSALTSDHHRGSGGGGAVIVDGTNATSSATPSAVDETSLSVTMVADGIVNHFERILRHCFLLLGAFLAGSYYPIHAPLASKVEEYVLVAWLTCLLIITVTAIQRWYQRRRFLRRRQQQHQQQQNDHRSNGGKTHGFDDRGHGGGGVGQQRGLRRDASNDSYDDGERMRLIDHGHHTDVGYGGDIPPQLPPGGDQNDDQAMVAAQSKPMIMTTATTNHHYHHPRQHQQQEQAQLYLTDETEMADDDEVDDDDDEDLFLDEVDADVDDDVDDGDDEKEETTDDAAAAAATTTVFIDVTDPAPPRQPPPSSSSATASGGGRTTKKDSNEITKKRKRRGYAVHPGLEPLFIVDIGKTQRIFPNMTEAFDLDTEYFVGKMLVLIRTPDVDDPTATAGDAENGPAVQYLAGKQRRFEFQFQVRLKRIPTGTVYFACELQDPVKMGVLQRAFVGAAMAFVKSTNSSFHYSMTGQAPTSDGRYERPHMAFPVEEGMNRVVVTTPEQPPPKLGEAIDEDPESIKRRKKGHRVDWNVHDTYTFSLWSAYVDFLQWRVINLPGIRPFTLSNVIGNNAINLTLYEIPSSSHSSTSATAASPSDANAAPAVVDKYHHRCDMIKIVEIEMCNTGFSGAGPASRRWLEESKLTGRSGTADDEDDDDDDDEPDIDGYEEEQHQQNLDDPAVVTEGANDDPGSGVDGVQPGAMDMEECDEKIGPLSDDDPDEDAAAELGEGIYVRSGDAFSLREVATAITGGATAPGSGAVSTADEGTDDGGGGNSMSPRAACYVANGGGFAVLQEQQSACSIVIEKAGRLRSSSRSKATASQLIKSGDTVMFKMVSKGRKKGVDDVEVRYLSIHRGWWLKWVGTAPTKNGYFTIHTNETEFNDDEDGEAHRSVETQSSYLTMGGSFWLRHKRWAKYRVGVAAEGSATYGGRILGLYVPKGGAIDIEGGMMYQSEDGLDSEQPDSTFKGKGKWMRPLQLQAFDVFSASNVIPTLSKSLIPVEEPQHDDGAEEKTKLVFSRDNFTADVPAWVEIMNRTKRVSKLVYAVRVLPPVPYDDEGDASTDSPEEDASDGNAVFMRLRSGRDLAPLVRLGLSSRNSGTSPRQRRLQSMDSDHNPQQNGFASCGSPPSKDTPETSQPDLMATPSAAKPVPRSMSLDLPEEDYSSAGEVEYEAESAEDDIVQNNEEGVETTRKGRKFIGKIARSVKTRTTSTRKKVVRQGVKVGKGTVSAGKAIIAPIRPRNPPSREPKSSKRQSRRRRERDLHVGVRRMGMRIMQRSSMIDSPSVLAGELSAPEQSCRTVSNMLSKMSSLPASAPSSKTFSALLASKIETPSDQDKSFLQGGALELGVVPSTGDQSRGPILFDCLVARCLWESHYREEYCGLHANGFAFYAPLTRSPCLELSFEDCQIIRCLPVGSSPLPGYPMVALETAWLCHYIVFASEEARQALCTKAKEAMAAFAEAKDPALTTRENELWKARFWQGFQNSFESSLSSGRGKWADVSSGSKMKSRVILNNRRMDFDLPPDDGSDLNELSEGLLSSALSLSLDTLKENPEALVKFLDATSQLRMLSLQDMDLSSPSTFCIFTNIYHCLLQHALVLSVNGPLHKKSCMHFMRTSCYEIGGDVFSLAELHSCVIRGEMSRAVGASAGKPPYLDVSRKSNAHRFYALSYTSPSVNFLLNTGDVACPVHVPVLSPDQLEVQLHSHVSDFLRRNFTVDASRRTVVIPKVCDVYRNDFASSNGGGGGFNHNNDSASSAATTTPTGVGASNSSTAGLACLRYCLKYLIDDPVATQVQAMLNDEVPIHIKYQTLSEQYHSVLRMRKNARSS